MVGINYLSREAQDIAQDLSFECQVANCICDAHDHAPLCRSWSCLVPEEQDDDLGWKVVSDGKTKRTARS